MSVRDNFIIEMALSGVATKDIATKLREKGIPTAKKTVGKVLNTNGYSYNKSTQTWIKNEANDELIETNSIKGIEQKKDKHAQLIETNKILNEKVQLIETNIDVWNEIGLSQQEFSIMKQMIRERMEHAATTINYDIYDEIARLKVRKRKNKTFYISEDITNEVTKLAEKLNLKISQLVEIALLEMIKKNK